MDYVAFARLVLFREILVIVLAVTLGALDIRFHYYDQNHPCASLRRTRIAQDIDLIVIDRHVVTNRKAACPI